MRIRISVSGVRCAFVAILLVAAGVCGNGQEVAPTSGEPVLSSAGSPVPALVRYAGELPGESGKRLALRFTVYASANSGSALWSESQSVAVGDEGKYSVLLGAGSSIGLPQSVFAAGEMRWLGVRIGDGPELERTELVSVPYAMKAGDAETLSGRAVAEFVTQVQLRGLVAAQIAEQGIAARQILPESTGPIVVGSGAAGYLPIWVSASTLGSSVLNQTGTGTSAKIGIGTTTPNAALDVAGGATVRGTLNMTATGLATSSAGVNSPLIEMTGSAYNSSTSAAVLQKFGWEILATGNNTAAPSANLALLFGTGTPVATGLSIAPTGIITFANGQSFPGQSGPLVNTIKAGAGLTSSVTGTTETLTVDATKVPLLAATTNLFAGDQQVSGQLTVGRTIFATSAGSDSTSEAIYANGLKGATGIYGNAALGTGVAGNSQSGDAVVGVSYSGKGGNFQSMNGDGVLGTSQSSFGVYGQSTSGVGISGSSLTGAGLSAGSNSGHAIEGYANDATTLTLQNESLNPTLHAVNFSDDSTALLFYVDSGNGSCSIDALGNIGCSGSVQGAVKTKSSGHTLATYAMQSTENWFEDAGTVQLVHGAAHVDLEPLFGETVNTGIEYHVFLTPDGDCKGLYVSAKGPLGFDVRELGGGKSSIAFEYRIMAKPVGREMPRLEDLTERMRLQKASVAKQRASSNRLRIMPAKAPTNADKD